MDSSPARGPLPRRDWGSGEMAASDLRTPGRRMPCLQQERQAAWGDVERRLLGSQRPGASRCGLVAPAAGCVPSALCPGLASAPGLPLSCTHSGCTSTAAKGRFEGCPRRPLRPSSVGIVFCVLEPARRWLREQGRAWVQQSLLLSPSEPCKQLRSIAGCSALSLGSAPRHWHAGVF